MKRQGITDGSFLFKNESTALIILLLIAFMPFVWSLGVRSRAGSQHFGDENTDS